MFLSAWNSQNKNALEYDPYLNIDYPSHKNAGTVIPYGDGPGSFYRDNIGRDIYINMINAAKYYIYITSPYLICDYAMMGTLQTAAKKGVDVRIVTPGIPDKKFIWLMTRASYEPLIRDGVKIYEYTPGFMHAKSFVCDDIFAVCGTINLDYRSLSHHFECGVWMYNTDAVKDMKEDLINTMELSELIPAKYAKLSRFQKLIRNIMKVFFPLL